MPHLGGAPTPDASEPTGFRVVEEYVHLDGGMSVAVVRPNATSGMVNPDIHPILTDHLGTPRKVLDLSTGQPRWEWDAKEPFGHQAPNQTPTAGLPAFALDLRFPGQRYDEATGLFQNGFQDYHAGLGRYVQSDPLGLEAGWNTYGKVLFSFPSRKRKPMKRHSLIIFAGILSLLTISFLFFFMSGVSTYTYKSKTGKEISRECRYYLPFKKCSEVKTTTRLDETYYLVQTVNNDNIERNSSYRLGWGKKNFCLSVDGRVLQIKSSQTELECRNNSVLVAEGECYRMDFRDEVYYCH